MRDLQELLEIAEPAWPLVQTWVSQATNGVRVLRSSREAGQRTLLVLQVTSRSPMGAIALETGGVLVADGWVRVLGAPGDGIKEGLVEWNHLDVPDESRRTVPGGCQPY